MDPLPHQACRAALSALLDGEEPSLPMDALMEHLAGCPDCSAWLEASTQVNARVRSLPIVERPLGERVVDRVDVHLCACRTGGRCLCGNCQCGPDCTCRTIATAAR